MTLTPVDTGTASKIGIVGYSFNGVKFDPSGDYVRRWVPELAGVAGGAVHDPALLAERRGRLDAPPGLAEYPLPIVDHAAERADALARYEAARR